MALQALAFLANPAFWQDVGSAASAGGSIASMFGLGKKKKGGGEINIEDLYPSWTKTAANTLAPWVQKYLPAFEPGAGYGGKFTAGETPFETTGLNILDKYLGGADTGELFGAGKQQILDTLGGKFADPNQSPFIKSMIALSKMNLTDQINAARGRRGARGTYYTEEGLREEGRLGERTQNLLNTIIGQFIEGERGKMFEAAPLAQGMDEYENVIAPLKKVTASQTLGSLRRLIEQADLEHQYQDFVRKRREMAMPLDAASLLMQSRPGGGGTLQAPITESNPLAGILNQIAPLIQSFQGMFKR